MAMYQIIIEPMLMYCQSEIALVKLWSKYQKNVFQLSPTK